jgi:hypothetical protein
VTNVPSDKALQDGMLVHYREEVKQSDSTIEAQVMAESIDDTLWTDCPFRDSVPEEIQIKKPVDDRVRLVGAHKFIDIAYGEKERSFNYDMFVDRILDPALEQLMR